MGSKKLLFVSIAFPPKSDPECIQTGRYYQALKKTKLFDIEVLTSSLPTLFMDEDKSLKSLLTGDDNIVHIKLHEWKILNWLLRKVLPNGIEWPDSKFSFHMKWKRAVRKITPPDIIYSRSFPISSTIMANNLAKHFNVPWVLHMSDPWSISPIHNRTPKNQSYQEQMEKECFYRANAICFTSLATIEAYQKIYPSLQHKFHLVPNVPYENTSPKDLNWGSKLKIVYTGGLAGKRSPTFFLKAIEKLIKNKPETANRFEVFLAGNMDRENAKQFTDSALFNVKHLSNLSLKDSIDLQQSAHVLLSIDNPMPKGANGMFLPSKIMDYIVSNRRVLALTTEQSATSRFLEGFNADVIELEDVSTIQKTVELYIEKYSSKDTSYFTQNKELPKKNTIAFNVNKLSMLFENIYK